MDTMFGFTSNSLVKQRGASTHLNTIVPIHEDDLSDSKLLHAGTFQYSWEVACTTGANWAELEERDMKRLF